MKSPRILRAVAALALAPMLLPQPAVCQQKKQPSTSKKSDPFLTGAPFTFEQVLRFVRENVISPRRQKEAILNRGLDFSLTPEDLEKFKAAGASEEMLAVIRERAKPEVTRPVVVTPPPPIVRPKQGGLVVTCAPAECEIFVGGVSKGPTRGGVLRVAGLAPGNIAVDFRKPGYIGSQAMITIEADKVSPLTAALEPDRATREAFGSELFKRMVQALGGAAAMHEALSVQAEGSLTAWAPDGKNTRWTIFLRNRPDRGLLQIKGAGSVFHEVAYVGSRFTTSKGLKGDDARELPDDFGLFREHQLAGLIERLSAPKFKMVANAAGRIVEAEGSTEKLSITLDNDLRPALVRFGTATGLGSGIVTYSDYAQIGAAYYPQSMQIKVEATKRGVDIHFDKIELNPKLKDSDYDLKKKPIPGFGR